MTRKSHENHHVVFGDRQPGGSDNVWLQESLQEVDEIDPGRVRVESVLSQFDVSS